MPKGIRTIKTMLTIMFNQRFALSFKVKDRKDITGIINIVIAVAETSSGGASATVSIGVLARTSVTVITPNSMNIHSTAIFIFQSSRFSPSHDFLKKILDV
ncbi:MAG: hypothetical protein QXZ25_05615 [Candidatus Bathyarchaeia archaeon]